ncbi:hypothetical protein CRYUN_Cryun20dG0065700 [Craigia yunnanensis]
MQQHLLALLPQKLLFSQFKHCSWQSQFPLCCLYWCSKHLCTINYLCMVPKLECGKCFCLRERSFYYLQVGHLDADRLNNLGSCMNREAGYG